MNQLPEVMELSDAELDLVTGGAPIVAGGLVNVALSDINIGILEGANIDVDISDNIRDVANNNNLSVGAIVQVLGGGAAIRQNQRQ